MALTNSPMKPRLVDRLYPAPSFPSSPCLATDFQVVGLTQSMQGAATCAWGHHGEYHRQKTQDGDQFEKKRQPEPPSCRRVLALRASSNKSLPRVPACDCLDISIFRPTFAQKDPRERAVLYPMPTQMSELHPSQSYCRYPAFV